MFFTIPIVLLTLGVTLAAHTTMLRTIILLLSVICGGFLLFGATAWLVVISTNRSARHYQDYLSERGEQGEQGDQGAATRTAVTTKETKTAGPTETAG
jgi:hypothetical protein